jgi:hypothetical protein
MELVVYEVLKPYIEEFGFLPPGKNTWQMDPESLTFNFLSEDELRCLCNVWISGDRTVAQVTRQGGPTRWVKVPATVGQRNRL